MGLFNFNKKKKFISKLSSEQRDEITITLILMKQMIDADGVDKPEEKEYYKKYLINCGISSKEELESILDRAGNLTSDQYDNIVDDFDEIQKLAILQELYGIICSDDEINENELGLLFQISRDMKIEDDIVMDMLGAKKDLLEEYFKKNDLIEDEKNKSKNNRVKNFNNVNEFLEASKLVDTSRLIDLYKIASRTSDSENGNTDFKIKLYTQIINEIPLLNNQSGGVVYTSEDLNDPLLEISDSDMGLHQIFLEEIYFNRAQAFKKLENLNEAEKDYQKAIDVNPGRNDATFYHYLGCAKFQLKRPIGDILNCFDNSIKYNKNDDAFSLRLSDTYYMRAAARLSDEKFSDAKKDIEKAFELDPKDDAIHRLKNEIEDILKNTSQNNNNKVESVTGIKKTDKFCSKCGEHFNGEEKFCTSCGNKRNIVELDDVD